MTSTDHPNIGYDYSRIQVEPRARSSSRNYEVEVPVRSHRHEVEYPRSEVYARSRYEDIEREDRTHAGFYGEDPNVYHATTHSNPDFKLSPTDAGGFRKLFAEECFRHIERRKRDFGEFRYQVTLLEAEVRAPLRPVELHDPRSCAHLLTSSVEPKQGGDNEGPPGARHLRIHHRHGHIPPAQLRGEHLRHQHQGHPGHGAGPVGVLGHGRPGHGGRRLLRAAVDGRAGQHPPLGFVVWAAREERSVPTDPRSLL